MSIASNLTLQPYLLNKPRVAVDVRPWSVVAQERGSYVLPPDGGVSVSELLSHVSYVLDHGVDDEWLMRVLASEERRGLLFTYVPDLTLTFYASPLIPSKLCGEERARLVANLIVRAFRPSRRTDGHRLDETWLRMHLNPQCSRWFATLSDAVGDPVRYADRWRDRALQLYRSSYGAVEEEEVQRKWRCMIEGSEDAGSSEKLQERDVALLRYPAQMYVISMWIRRLGFAHLFDWDTEVSAPLEDSAARLVASEYELNLVQAERVLSSDVSWCGKIQLSIYWFYGICPDAVSDDRPDRWRLRHVSGWSVEQLRPRLH